ncbi:hypothetical protein F4825DRAFT_443045 [Nemania diffusa]|nr:hypothetical protein F4825DRAFT_443045 [Nemania diffusa]
MLAVAGILLVSVASLYIIPCDLKWGRDFISIVAHFNIVVVVGSNFHHFSEF